MSTPTASVHRFRDKVAVHVGNGATVYMSPDEASKLARALTGCARDIRARSFVSSHFPTVSIPLEGKQP